MNCRLSVWIVDLVLYLRVWIVCCRPVLQVTSQIRNCCCLLAFYINNTIESGLSDVGWYWSLSCQLSSCTASYISESDCRMSADTGVWVVSCRPVLQVTSQSRIVGCRLILESELSAVVLYCKLHLRVGLSDVGWYWSLSCQLSSCTASYISESELSAVGLNSRLSPSIHQTIESELSADLIC